MTQKLDFSGRARRRERRTRLSLAAWGISTVATLVGIPTGTNALAQLGAQGDTTARSSSTSTVVLFDPPSDDTRRRTRRVPRPEPQASTLVLARERSERIRAMRMQRRRERLQERRAARRAERRREQREEREERAEEAAAPAPEPAPEPGTVSGIIAAAAAEYGLDADYLTSVAWCESSLDPGAVSPAGYYGLFQFDQSTWAAYGYGSIYDPVAQSRTAARMIAGGLSEKWPNCA
jgi:soluble lytic murein transglycosylase-like protein